MSALVAGPIGMRAREWIGAIPLDEGYPDIPGAVTALGKLVLLAAWEAVTGSKEAIPPWGIAYLGVPPDALAWAIGMPGDSQIFAQTFRDLHTGGWMGTGLGGTPVLAWGRPFRECDKGHLYAYEFTNGVVKFGRTACLVRRRKEHAANARKFGLSIAREWASTHVDGANLVEDYVLGRLRSEQATAGGHEYFYGGFDTALEALGADPMEVDP